MSRLSLAVRAFFGLLSQGKLPHPVASALGLVLRRDAVRPQAAPPAPSSASDGAMQLLGVLQRDARLIDFLMEDITSYSDDQIGAAVRSLHQQCAQSLARCVKLAPVIDGVEGTFARAESSDPASIKLLGKVPPDGRATGGTLRHKGWRAESVTLPAPVSRQNAAILAPAEIEVE